jgi:DNA-binding response OmpR family regulator
LGKEVNSISLSLQAKVETVEGVDMKKKILVADDNPHILEVVSMALETLDFEVILAQDGEEALEQSKKERPDLIILDIMMPKKNGLEVCRELKGCPQYQEIPIIMLSAKTQREDKFWGRDAGADDYVTKPFDPLELERVVTRLLKLKESGEGYHPLTRLPSYPSIEKEIKRREEAKDAFSICEMRFQPEASEVFEQKYGGLKWEELLSMAAYVLQEQAERWGDNRCFSGHKGGSTLVAIGPTESLEKIGRATVEEVNKAIPTFYSKEDLARGCVLRGEEKHPLLSFSYDISPPS